MKERPGDTRKEDAVRGSYNVKREEATRERIANVTKSANMPNPVKGLQLSLYPIIKEH